MSKIMLVNVTHVEESRVVILEDGVLAAYDIETINRTSIKGNIYNAIVESTHTSLEAAFIKIQPDMKGFLPLDEVNFKLLPPRGEERDRGRIGQHLHPGQKIMVQVVREPFAGKPPTVSTFFSLPGRYLVLMPGVESGGISRKIGDQKHRDRLKKILGELKPPEGFGIIVRTAGIGQTKAELQRDLRYLLRLWESIQKGSAAREFPGLVYRERDLVLRTIRDHFTPDISEVWIDSQETYDKALEFVRDVMPKRAKNLRLYTGERPLFNKYNLEQQIETIYKRKVPLPSGGEIVIDGTEALTAIDVNSARSSRKANAEENATQTNLEAAKEIVRQFRLRDLGGLVVVDFIDMMQSRNQKKVEKAVRDAMRGDRARYDITRLSKLGLMEIARQRLKGEKMAATYTTCSSCEGYGLVKNIEAAGLSALRKLQTRATRGGFGTLVVSLPPEVAGWLLNNKREELSVTEQRSRIRISVESKAEYLRHEIGFQTIAREKGEEIPVPPPEPPRQEVEPPEPPAKKEQAAAAEPAEGEPKQAPAAKKRRRRRRKPAAEARKTEAEETKAVAAPETKPEDAGGPAPEDASAAEASGTEPEAPAPRKRKRRRRKRKPRGGNGKEAASGDGDGGGGAGGGGGGGGAGGNAPAPERALVPRTVKSYELMPAAVGKGSEGRRKSALKPKPRKRKAQNSQED